MKIQSEHLASMPRNRQNHQDEDGDTVTVKSAETSRLGVKCCLDEIPGEKRDIRQKLGEAK